MCLFLKPFYFSYAWLGFYGNQMSSQRRLLYCLDTHHSRETCVVQKK